MSALSQLEGVNAVEGGEMWPSKWNLNLLCAFRLRLPKTYRIQANPERHVNKTGNKSGNLPGKKHEHILALIVNV